MARCTGESCVIQRPASEVAGTGLGSCGWFLCFQHVMPEVAGACLRLSSPCGPCGATCVMLCCMRTLPLYLQCQRLQVCG